MTALQYLANRSLHVLGAGFVTGGAAVLWLNFYVDGEAATGILARFEALFWVIFGLLVFTGLGNVVGFGAPGIGTLQGSAIGLKLTLAIGLAVISLVRSFAVMALLSRAEESATGLHLRLLYAATVWIGIVIVVLAGVVARG